MDADAPFVPSVVWAMNASVSLIALILFQGPWQHFLIRRNLLGFS